jgi:hypothetical protein
VRVVWRTLSECPRVLGPIWEVATRSKAMRGRIALLKRSAQKKRSQLTAFARHVQRYSRSARHSGAATTNYGALINLRLLTRALPKARRRTLTSLHWNKSGCPLLTPCTRGSRCPLSPTSNRTAVSLQRGLVFTLITLELGLVPPPLYARNR